MGGGRLPKESKQILSQLSLVLHKCMYVLDMGFKCVGTVSFSCSIYFFGKVLYKYFLIIVTAVKWMR